MLSATTENVISLLTSLGFGDEFPAEPNGIVIDNFDQWVLPDVTILSGCCGPTCISFPEEELAA